MVHWWVLVHCGPIVVGSNSWLEYKGRRSSLYASLLYSPFCHQLKRHVGLMLVLLLGKLLLLLLLLLQLTKLGELS
jgi:hypothetical protein